MAYSSVGRPVFYIDNYQYHKTIGTQIEINLPESTYSLESTPVFPLTLENRSLNLPVNPINYDFTRNMKYYIAFLNHDFYGNGAQIQIHDENDIPNVGIDFEEVLNGNGNGGGTFMPLNGSTILTTSVAHDTTMYKILSSDMFAGVSVNVGTVSYGIQYTMPHSPDLKLSMEIEMDGINTTNTSGGGTISNVKYTGNPLWINGDNKTNCFDVYENTLDVTQTGARRNGRKSWNLKFSYISETDLFSSNPKGGNYTEHPADSTYNNGDLSSGAQHSENTLAFNIETDDSFYAQVWNKTLGGALPFIFQPDSNDNDDFYMCRFDQNSLRVTQSAYKVYDVSVKIVETW